MSQSIHKIKTQISPTELNLKKIILEYNEIKFCGIYFLSINKRMSKNNQKVCVCVSMVEMQEEQI